LSGRYITAEDVGMETSDMDLVRTVTPFVTGISESQGGAGNPSPVTAYGVFMGMKAACKFKYGSDDMEDRKVIVQGIGHVGESLVEYLTDEGAKVIIDDIDTERLHAVSNKYGAIVYEGKDLYSEDVDVYAPCALGATINDESINRIKAKVIAGAANNQLANEIKHGAILQDSGIVYAPDFLINAGGIINVYAELEGYGKSEIMRRTENIFNTTLEILHNSKSLGITPNESALRIAMTRIADRKKENTK